MTAYVRPPILRQVFHDADGVPFEYGRRWDHLDGPPEDTYSVDSHPERFAPLAGVADALVRHLAATYAVTVEDVDLRGVDLASHTAVGPAHPVLARGRNVGPAAVRAVRVTPAGAAAAHPRPGDAVAGAGECCGGRSEGGAYSGCSGNVFRGVFAPITVIAGGGNTG
mgnify:CR=1 FL=1